jgi:hypothetical protein
MDEVARLIVHIDTLASDRRTSYLGELIAAHATKGHIGREGILGGMPRSPAILFCGMGYLKLQAVREMRMNGSNYICYMAMREACRLPQDTV